MSPAPIDLLGFHPWVALRRFVMREYHRMREVGLFQDERVELIEGQIVRKAPKTGPHVAAVIGLTRPLLRAAGDAALVSIQLPVQLGPFSDPEPDAALLVPCRDDKEDRPQAHEVLLAVEVVDGAVDYERRVKRPLYAHHGIPELWIVELGRPMT